MKIYDIITLNKTKNLSLQSFTVDFESGLINATNKVFNKCKCAGCYYHYTRAVKENARAMKILSSDRKNITEKLLKELYEASFKYNSDKNYLSGLLYTYEKTYSFLNDYIAYFKEQWFTVFEIGMLDYILLRVWQKKILQTSQ